MHVEYSLVQTVPRLVERQAAVNPNSVAVAEQDCVLTYHDLNSRAGELANRLCSIGVGPDVLVGLCLKSSIAMVVGALGILKAGGAYLPLDPAYPAERLSFILNDAKAPVLVAAQCQARSLPAGAWRVIGLDIEGRMADGPSSPSPVTEAAPESLAYVIYTSGSSGQPKGVEIAHKSLMNLVCWHQHAFAVTPADRASQLGGVGFDAAVWELWPYLTAGASVHLADEAIRTEPEALRDWLLSRQITISFIPTVMAERIMALDWPAEIPLRVVLTGADTLYRYPSAKLPFLVVNNYGPTECTVVATSTPVLPDERPSQRPPIGRPITNTQVYILDEHLKPVPNGTPGELHIGGAGLARGYLNLPELTAEKFIPNPFAREPGARLYKTGDLARYLPDGQIAFLARIDEQVKIRGYRIEPNEIVSALNQYPAVLESAVVARELGSGDKQLTAYFVASSEGQLSYADLRDFLGARLPEYMVPSTFVRVGWLPLTPHGKIDRAALPEPTAENTLNNEAFQPPSSPVEERLARILTTLLGVEQVGRDDNFFQMGGHSLLGAQVIARVRDGFGVQLSLRFLFDHPTMREMSAEIENLIFAKLEVLSGDQARHILDPAEGVNA
jgi:amino acid adenylation domain-containing protein